MFLKHPTLSCLFFFSLSIIASLKINRLIIRLEKIRQRFQHAPAVLLQHPQRKYIFILLNLCQKVDSPG